MYESPQRISIRRGDFGFRRSGRGTSRQRSGPAAGSRMNDYGRPEGCAPAAAGADAPAGFVKPCASIQ
jgi:hypothetical protein